MGGLTSIWKDRGVTLETKVKLVKVLVFPIVLYGAETWTMRKHERRKIDAFELWCWRSIVDGEKDKHIDHREHQTGMDTGVKGGKGCIKLRWTRGESRKDGRWRDARENEWSEKERKTKAKMGGHSQGVCERSHDQQHETRRQRESGMERSCHGCCQGSDATRWHKVTRWLYKTMVGPILDSAFMLGIKMESIWQEGYRCGWTIVEESN